MVDSAPSYTFSSMDALLEVCEERQESSETEKINELLKTLQ